MFKRICLLVHLDDAIKFTNTDCYATLLPAALVADPTRAPHAASTRRQCRVSANDTRPARLAPYERVPFNSLFSLANIPNSPQRLLEFLYDLISLH